MHSLRCSTMKHMDDEVGIRALKQNASAVVARAAAGEIITITDRGRPVARLTPMPASRLQEMIDAGLARPAKRSILDLPERRPGPSLSAEIIRGREQDRF